MSYHVRNTTQDDIPDLEKLLVAFMQETFQRTWGGTTQKLAQDGFGAEFEMVVAEAKNQQLTAFAAWASSYDLHYCLKGGEVIDLFVDPAYQGWGVATKLIFAIATQIQQQGGLYIKGQASRTQAFNVSISGVRDVFREPIVMCLDALFGDWQSYQVKVCAT
ncbi:GNAT family N-acetyltransferase [Komarekiella delphini-convector]|nr:GNAT family N-acetyltransferase [Komarekiella delphini-convector]